MVTREECVQVHARGELELKQRGDRVGMRGLLYFLKSHPMKDGGPMVWQMMDLKIWMYTERYRRQGGREESQADDGNNAKGPRNFWVKVQVEQSQKLPWTGLRPNRVLWSILKVLQIIFKQETTELLECFTFSFFLTYNDDLSIFKSSLEKEMVPHSSILAWRIPWTEEPGGLQFMASHRVGHDWVNEHTF